MNQLLPEADKSREPEVFKQLGLFLLLVALLGGLLFLFLAGMKSFFPDFVRRDDAPWIWEAGAGALALAYLAGVGIYSRRLGHFPELRLPLACTVLVGLFWLAFVRQTYGAKWDFGCYFLAGKLIGGGNIYDPALLEGHRYIYSPLLATIFSGLRRLPAHRQFELAYWGWSLLNYWLVMGYFLLLAAALRLYKVHRPWLWPGAAGAVVFNVPLQRTLIYSQANLAVVCLLLGGLLLYRRKPAGAGGLLGAAALLKSSPALLLLPAIIEKRWKTVIGFLGAGIILIAGSIALVGSRPWRDFLGALPQLHSHAVYRDNSLQSLVFSFSRLPRLAAGKNDLLLGLAFGLTLLSVGWFIGLATRPKFLQVMGGEARSNYFEAAFPFYLLAMLVASPYLWEHHWLMGQLAFCLLAARAAGTRWLLPALICYALVFLIPTFDIFLFSYHRLAGLILWVVVVCKLAQSESPAPAPVPG
jgi:hypothetical protein